MEGMGRHIERNNVVILTVLFELDRVVAFVTVKDKKTFGAFSTRFNMLVKVLDLFQTQFVRCLAVRTGPDPLIAWHWVVAKLSTKVVLPR